MPRMSLCKQGCTDKLIETLRTWHRGVHNNSNTRVQVGPLPMGYAEGCAKAIVNGACRKKRYVTWPFWFKVMFLYKSLAPEVLEWCYRILYVKKPRSSQPATSKVLLEASGAKNVMYPESIK
ncbi:unnamed protein product [Victoria cruziana]